MQLQIESTDMLTEINGVPCRRWTGITASGIECHVFVHRIAVDKTADCAQFDRELQEMDPPTGPRTIPLSAIL